MKSFLIKTALASSVLLASGAWADVALPGSGNGELTLFVKNETTGAVYARGLQVNIDGVLTSAAIVGDASYTPGEEIPFSFSSPLAPDATLSSFLNGTNTFSWSIIAGDSAYPSGQANVLGNQRYAFTSLFLDPNSAPFNSDLTTSYANLQAMMQQLNTNLGGVVGSGNSISGIGGLGGIWGEAGTTGEFAQDWFGTGTVNAVDLGTASAFYVLSSSGGGNFDQSRAYLAGTFQLSSNGTLTFTPNATGPVVPLPAAVWLLLSGLGGLGVVGRRRSAQAA